MTEDLRIFLRDVVEHAPCSDCGVGAGVPCEGTDEPDVPAVFGTHEVRVKTRRSQMTDDDYARSGLKMLEHYRGRMR